MSDFKTAKLAYLIGALADGSIYHNRTQYIYRVTYYQNSKEYLLKCIEPLVENLFGKKGYFYHDKRTNVYSYMVVSKRIYAIYVDALEDFKAKQRDRSVPMWMRNGTLAIKYAFIRGFFDAEGFYYNNPKKYDYRVRFGQAERLILRDIKQMLEPEFKVSDVLGPYQTKQGVKPYYELHLYGKKQIKHFHDLIRPCHPEKQLDSHS